MEEEMGYCSMSPVTHIWFLVHAHAFYARSDIRPDPVMPLPRTLVMGQPVSHTGYADW